MASIINKWSRPIRSALMCVVGVAALLTSACAPPGSSSVGAAPDLVISRTTLTEPDEMNPLAPTSAEPVLRNGHQARPSIKGGAGRLNAAAPVRYPDNVVITVNKTAARSEHGQGPGVFASRPYVVLALTLTNGSKFAIDLNQVVATLEYGSPARLAAPVYEDSTATDFSGIVAPAGTAHATYLFAVPVAKRQAVVARVDFDGLHSPAIFRGDVR